MNSRNPSISSQSSAPPQVAPPSSCAYSQGQCYHAPVAGKAYCDLHLCVACGREKQSSLFRCKSCSGGGEVSPDAKNLHRVNSIQPTRSVLPQGVDPHRRNTIAVTASEPTPANSSWQSQSHTQSQDPSPTWHNQSQQQDNPARRSTIPVSASEPTVSNWQDHLSSWQNQSHGSLASRSTSSFPPSCSGSFSATTSGSGGSFSNPAFKPQTPSSQMTLPGVPMVGAQPQGGSSSFPSVPPQGLPQQPFGGSFSNAAFYPQAPPSQMTFPGVPVVGVQPQAGSNYPQMPATQGLPPPQQQQQQQPQVIHVHHHHHHGGKAEEGENGDSGEDEDDNDNDKGAKPRKRSTGGKLARHAGRAGKVADAAGSIFSLVSKVASVL